MPFTVTSVLCQEVDEVTRAAWELITLVNLQNGDRPICAQRRSGKRENITWPDTGNPQELKEAMSYYKWYKGYIKPPQTVDDVKELAGKWQEKLAKERMRRQINRKREKTW